MKALRAPSPVPPLSLIRFRFFKPVSGLSFTLNKPHSPLTCLTHFKKSKFNNFTAISPSAVSAESLDQDEKFDWYSQWYAIMPVCDLDKRAPHGKKVMGLDVVVWSDKNENAWKVFDDMCPHRLAPLSEGRIDQWGRLQCVYHGWCFSGSGDCKLIPQAPLDGPLVHTLKRRVSVCIQAPCKTELFGFGPTLIRDTKISSQRRNHHTSLRYEILIENIMDPAHLPYAHYGIMSTPQPRGYAINIDQMHINGFTTNEPYEQSKFVPPCHHILVSRIPEGQSAQKQPRLVFLIFICIPVSPGNSRMIILTGRNFALWIDQVVPRWIYHIGQNLIICSDMYLLHIEEKKLMEAGFSNWQKVCYVPTKSDAKVVAFRKWLKKYSGGQVDWGNKFNGSLPPTPPREQLMDRYWSHVVNCSSCNGAYKGLSALKVALQVFSVAAVAMVSAAKQGMISVAARNTLAVAAVLCFVGSKWLSHFVYKCFHYHAYDHAFV